MKDLKHIKRFNESDENLNISDVSDSDLFHDDGQDLLEPLSNLLHPLYKKHGLEKTKEFLKSIIHALDDVGSEFFGE